MEFTLKTKVILGINSLEKLRDYDYKNVYIICDPFMKTSGIINKLIEVLEDKNSKITIFSQVIPNPDIETISKAISLMLRVKPDAIIALGGGSALDTAKTVRFICDKVDIGNRADLIAIPTTSGTGSEVTSFSVISDNESKIKIPMKDEEMTPDIAIVDPQFTASVPNFITADTGMDALTHAVEAYVSKESNDFSDALAEKSIRLIFDLLPRAVKDGMDMEAREGLHNASSLAGASFNEASLGICHSMAHALGARFNLSHGRACAILLPYVIEFNAGLDGCIEEEASRKYEILASSLGVKGHTKISSVHNLIRNIKSLNNKIGIPSTLEGLGIDYIDYEKSIVLMAKQAIKDACTSTNPREPSIMDIETIYKKLSRGGML